MLVVCVVVGCDVVLGGGGMTCMQDVGQHSFMQVIFHTSTSQCALKLLPESLPTVLSLIITISQEVRRF